MRKLILALTALACLHGAAYAQQQQKVTADQGAAGGAPWPVSWTGQSVLADLRVAGSPVASGNPVPASITNFPTTQAVTQSGAWTLSNLFVLDATVTARLGTLGQKASAGSAPVVLASDQPALPLSTGASTSANQSRNNFVAPTTTASLGAGSTLVAPTLDQGSTSSLYSWINAEVWCTQNATYVVQGSNDNTTFYTRAQVAFTANTATTVRIATSGWRYNRVYIANGGTAAAAGGQGIAAYVVASQSAN